MVSDNPKGAQMTTNLKNGTDTDEKLGWLQGELKKLNSVIVAYSGGVDSAFLLKVAHDTLSATGGRVLAVTARSASYPQSEMASAKELAKSIGAEHRIIDSDELENPAYQENPTDRCYFCKGELFGLLDEIAKAEGYNAILDGANADDLTDHRPGSKAAREKSVHSPLQMAQLTKQEIRQISKSMGLPTWDKPSAACLASRIPYGDMITTGKLSMVEQAELVLKDMGFGQLRVRHHGNIARIELDPSQMSKALDPATSRAIHSALKQIGYSYITLDILGYRTGSMNEVIEK